MKIAAIINTAQATHRVELPVRTVGYEQQAKTSKSFCVYLVTESSRRLVVAASLTEAHALSLYAKLRTALFQPPSPSQVMHGITVDCLPDDAHASVSLPVADLLELVKTAAPEDIVKFTLEDGSLRYCIASWKRVG